MFLNFLDGGNSKPLPTKEPVRVYQQSCRPKKSSSGCYLHKTHRLWAFITGTPCNSQAGNSDDPCNHFGVQGSALEHCVPNHLKEYIQINASSWDWPGSLRWVESVGREVSGPNQGRWERRRRKNNEQRLKENKTTWETASSNSIAHICPSNSHEPDKLNLKQI